MTCVSRWTFTNYALPENFAPDTYDSDQPPISWPDKIKFGICQLEICPTSSRRHIQGYVVLLRSCRLSALKKIPGYESAHWEPAKGSTADNVRYCSKEESRLLGPWRFGEEGTTGSGARTDLVSLKRSLDEGASDKQIADEHFGAFLRYGTGIARYRAIAATPRSKSQDTPLCVVLGKSGLGKTRWVFQETGELYVKSMDAKWWDGFNGVDSVLIDDFVGGLPFGELLRLANSGPYQVEQKNGRVNFNPKELFITSNIRPDRWYRKAGLNMDPLLRRISRVVHFTGYREYSEWKSDDDYPANPESLGAFGKYVITEEAQNFLNYQVVEIE